MRPPQAIYDELSAEFDKLSESQRTGREASDRIVALSAELYAAGGESQAALDSIRATLSGVGTASMPALAMTATAERTPEEKPATMKEIEPVVREILLASPVPVGTKDMLARLQKRGLVIGGKRPEANLSARLSQMDAFENIDRTGWSLKKSREPGPRVEDGQAGDPGDENWLDRGAPHIESVSAKAISEQGMFS